MPEPRILDDPHDATQWRMNGLTLEWRYNGRDWTGGWHAHRHTQHFRSTSERRALWRDLFIHPV